MVFGSRRWVLLAFFFSGASGLIAEVVWVRLLKLTVGNTVQAASLVIAVFLGGLALGAFLAGRMADRLRAPVRAYILIECAVAALILISPWTLAAADWLYRWLPSRIVASALVLLPPTVLMGATLPVLGSFLGDSRRLYAINTLGAMTGCFLAGFVLLKAWGVGPTLCAAAAASLLAALCARQAGDVAEVRSSPPNVTAGPAAAAGGRWWAVSFVAGFAGIGFEVLWVRGLISLVPATTYVFAAVLTVYLAGTMLGAWWAARFQRGLATVLVVAGLLGMALVPWLAVAQPLTGLLPQQVRLQPLLIAGFLFLAPACVVGMCFPLVLAAWRGAVGTVTGQAYAASALGSVAGGLVTGFVLLPGTGLQNSSLLLGGMLALTGVLLWPGRWPWLMVPVVAAVAWLMPGGWFERLVVARLQRQYRATGVLHVREGITTAVSVHSQRETRWTVPLTATSFTARFVATPADTRHLCVSGQHIASDEPGQRAWQTFHGHSAMLLHGAAQRVLGIGYGSGETMACLSRHRPAVLECVEISPEVVAAARQFFRHINRDDASRVILADGRNHLHLTTNRYDLILSDPINPLHGDNASLYTREFFQLARERLQPGGLFLCWLPLHLPRAVLESIVATSLDVFPCVTVWTIPIAGGTFVQLVGSVHAQAYAPASIERQLANPAVGGDLARIGIRSSAGFLAYYRGDQTHLAACLRTRRLNTDARPVVEFNTAPAQFKTTTAMILELLAPAGRASLPGRLDWQGLSPAAQAAWWAEYETAQRAILP